MKHNLLMLVKLAEIDAVLNEIQDGRDQVPGFVRDLETQIAVLQKEITALAGKLGELESAKSTAEMLIREKKAWIEQREGQVKDIKTNKEYHAALKEVSIARKEIMDAEAKITTLSEQITSVGNELEEIKAKNLPKIEEVNAQIAAHRQTIADANPSWEEKQKARQAVVVEIDAKIMVAYEHVRQRVMPAIAQAEGGICAECGTRIMPQLFNRLFHLAELINCPRCRRILYVEAVIGKE